MGLHGPVRASRPRASSGAPRHPVPNQNGGMMAPHRQLRPSMDMAPSVTRSPRRRRLLLAHHPSSATCDRLLASIEQAFLDVELVDASSVEDARLALARSRFDA